MEPFLEHNRKVKRNINFYEHPAKDIQTPIAGHSPVYVIQMQEKYKRIPTPRLQAVYPQGRSLVLNRSSHLGETSDYKETQFNYEKPPTHSSSVQYSAKLQSKSKGSSKSAHKESQSTLEQKATKSQFAPRGAPNRAYVEDESDHHIKRSNRAKGSDNYGFSRDDNDRELSSHHNEEISENKQQPIEVQVQIVDRFVLVLGFFLHTNSQWKCRPFLRELKLRNP